MSNLDTIIANATTAQDIELANALATLKSNPTDLAAFLQNQQSKVYNNITEQKEDTFQKVYGDLKLSERVQGALLQYGNRSTDLSNLQNNVYINQKTQADAVLENKNTFGRKYEMNEWSVNNKKDTLFVFSVLFVILSVIILFTVFLRLNLISSNIWSIICIVSIIIFILIVMNRAEYTNLIRNKRYWNKKNFPGNAGKVPASNCQPPVPPGSMTPQ
jgi:hypothetical protein